MTMIDSWSKHRPSIARKSFTWTSDRILDNKQIVQNFFIRTSKYNIRYVSQRRRDDRDVVMMEIKQSGESLNNESDYFITESPLKYASERLKDDKELVLFAATICPNALLLASDRLRHDRSFLLEVLSMEYTQQDCKNDRKPKQSQIIIENKKNVYHPYIDIKQLFNDELLDDREFVIKMVSNHGWRLCYANPRYRDDETVVVEACRNGGRYSALRSASKRLKDHKETILKIVKENGTALEHVSDRLREDWEVVVEAVKSSVYALRFVPIDQQRNKELIMIHVSSGHPSDERCRLEVIDQSFSSDYEVVTTAVEKDWRNLLCTSEDFQRDPRVVVAALTNCELEKFPFSANTAFCCRKQKFRQTVERTFRSVFSIFREIEKVLTSSNDRRMDDFQRSSRQYNEEDEPCDEKLCVSPPNSKKSRRTTKKKSIGYRCVATFEMGNDMVVEQNCG